MCFWAGLALLADPQGIRQLQEPSRAGFWAGFYLYAGRFIWESWLFADSGRRRPLGVETFYLMRQGQTLTHIRLRLDLSLRIGLPRIAGCQHRNFGNAVLWLMPSLAASAACVGPGPGFGIPKMSWKG